ncbi:MAG: hypothetical protein GY796_36965, partial [Chloroflexi bacterium]|nr:hypothetical protein [Chloroflexota bacterium]
PQINIHNSSFEQNGVSGLTNSSGTAVDARFNWWGDVSGPGGIGPGSGDAVQGNVLYAPWQESPGCTPLVLPAIAITDSTAVESAGLMTFTVWLDQPSTGEVTVNYATQDSTAVSGTDYLATSGTLTFSSGVLTQTIAITLLDNALVDGSRAFTLTLNNPVNGVLGHGTAVGTINDDDIPIPSNWIVYLPIISMP